ncbi:MAG: hypothetical protein ABW098_01945 [Candidatus Thiodiazotropha sp.]
MNFMLGGVRGAHGFLSPSPWPSPARGEGIDISSASNTSNQVLDSSYLFVPVLDPYVPSPLAGEGQGEGEPMTGERSELNY